MAIYYVQILNRKTKKILTGSFSLAGEPLKTNKMLLVHFKKAIDELPNNQKIFSLHSQDNTNMYFYKIVNEIILSCIADNRATGKMISKYFEEIEKSYFSMFSGHTETHYEFDDKLKKITDDFNKKFKMMLGVEELENTHTSLVENLDKVINRGENINNLKDLAEKVSFETKEMSRRVNKMKMDAKYNEYKVYLMIILAILILLFIFYKLR